MDSWKNKLKLEFHRADQARLKKNEGQARVCARRAAGIAIREYLGLKGIQPPSTSAIDLLDLLRQDAQLAPGLFTFIDHLTMRVAGDFKLPADVDLIEDARQLCRNLVGDWE